MIAGVRGVVEAKGADWLVIGVGGVSLRLSVPAGTAASARPGEELRLRTHLYVREEQLSLFGFGSEEELALFELLIGVSGMGPRLALALLSVLRPEQAVAALASGDTATLTRVPGVGTKMAHRLTLELRDKVGGLGVQAAPAPGALDADVVAALVSLGYSTAEAARIAGAVSEPGTSTEERLRAALMRIGKG